MPTHFSTLPHLGIQTLTPYEPGKSIESLKQELGLTDIIKLASNENPLGCGPKAKTALESISPYTLTAYPSANFHPLHQALCDRLKISKEQLILANGSDALFSLLMTTFALHTGRTVLTHEYAFNAYTIQAQTLGIQTQIAPVASDWSVNIQSLIEASTSQTAILFLANPNNPTGLTVSQDDIKLLLKHLPPTTLLVLDEAYYGYPPEQPENTIEWLETYPNLVILRTFSKIYGLAGLRIGYAIANSEIIALLKRAQLPFTINQAAMAAALAALDDIDFLNQSLITTNVGMKQLEAGFKALNLTPHPSFANFITVDMHQSALPVYEKLLHHGIIVRPLHPYGLTQHLRITIGTAEQNTRLLEALPQCL